MKIFSTIADLRQHLSSSRPERGTTGFVPTMGALHEGHLSLLKASLSENAVTVCSIFVNPAQFNNPDDLLKYPRTLAADTSMLEAAGCDILFAPSVAEMYPVPPVTGLQFGTLEHVMEGKFRPGHFSGVGIVVAKLFHIVQPDNVYFGQKDLQQTAVVKSLVRDLSFPLSVRICPTLREKDGLAMSSRNMRLTPEERSLAPHIFRILSESREALASGETVDAVRAQAVQSFEALPAFRLEYFEVVNNITLQSVATLQPEGETAICVAAYLGEVRLIDNVIL